MNSIDPNDGGLILTALFRRHVFHKEGPKFLCQFRISILMGNHQELIHRRRGT